MQQIRVELIEALPLKSRTLLAKIEYSTRNEVDDNRKTPDVHRFS
jgi:hypothetical protein